MLLRRFVRCTSEGITSQKALPLYEMSLVISLSPWQRCILNLVIEVMQDAVRGWQYTEGAGSTEWAGSRKRLHLPSRWLAPTGHEDIHLSMHVTIREEYFLKTASLYLFPVQELMCKKIALYPSQSFTRCFSFLFFPLPLGFHLQWKKDKLWFWNKSGNCS